MWALILFALVGLPLFGVFREQVGDLGFVVVGLIWLLVLLVVWFRAPNYAQLTSLGRWVYALTLDVFFFFLLYIATNVVPT